MTLWQFAAATSALMALGAVMQMPLLFAFLRRFRMPSLDSVSPPDEIRDKSSLPFTTVILCLRGCDPFLTKCLSAALSQDYANYELLLVLDSPEDSAVAVVKETLDSKQSNRPRVRILFLDTLPESCGLKCASLVHACRNLDSATEIVALMDADTQPHAGWLSDLLLPFQDELVGASTGNRWYMPSHFSWASLQRYLWNTNAVVQMVCFKIPWGGTLAFRRSLLESSELLELWQKSFCEDTLLYGVLRQQRLSLAFVPSLIIVNREDCEFAGMAAWIRRQLIAARLYHPNWFMTAAHGILGAAFWGVAIGTILLASIQGDATSFALALLGPIAYTGILLALLPILEATMARVIAGRNESTAWMTPATRVALPFAALAFQLVYPCILLSAILAKQVRWRKIDYRIDGPFKIRRLNYVPYLADDRGEHQSL